MTCMTNIFFQIKERVEKFDRFVRENEVKRQRALVKFQNERKQQVQLCLAGFRLYRPYLTILSISYTSIMNDYVK